MDTRTSLTVTRIAGTGPATTYRTDTYPVGGHAPEEDRRILSDYAAAMAHAGVNFSGGSVGEWSGTLPDGGYIFVTVAPETAAQRIARIC